MRTLPTELVGTVTFRPKAPKEEDPLRADHAIEIGPRGVPVIPLAQVTPPAYK
jgi:hypothetical protein